MGTDESHYWNYRELRHLEAEAEQERMDEVGKASGDQEPRPQSYWLSHWEEGLPGGLDGFRAWEEAQPPWPPDVIYEDPPISGSKDSNPGDYAL